MPEPKPTSRSPPTSPASGGDAAKAGPILSARGRTSAGHASRRNGPQTSAPPTWALAEQAGD